MFAGVRNGFEIILLHFQCSEKRKNEIICGSGRGRLEPDDKGDYRNYDEGFFPRSRLILNLIDFTIKPGSGKRPVILYRAN
jgi:hypothetical protein